jgi:hypothetical protein
VAVKANKSFAEFAWFLIAGVLSKKKAARSFEPGGFRNVGFAYL